MQKKGLGHRVISAMDVNPLLPHFSKVLKKHHKSMLFNKLYLQEVFYSPHMASLRQPPNLRSLLRRSSLYQVNSVNRLKRNTMNM